MFRNISFGNRVHGNSHISVGRCKQIELSGLAINREQVDQDINNIYNEFEVVEKRLRDGRPYLFGDRFTAADISFACMGGAILLPSPNEGYGAYLPPLDNSCEELSTIAKDLRKSPAGKWVLGLYRNERGQRLLPASPHIH